MPDAIGLINMNGLGRREIRREGRAPYELQYGRRHQAHMPAAPRHRVGGG
jgi:hypothetical protein